MKKIYIFLSAIVILGVSFFISYKFIIKANNTNDSNNKNSLINPSEKKDPTISAPVENKKEILTYDILGSSLKYPDAAMKKWRLDVVDLSKKYPSNLFINGQAEDKLVALTFDDGPDGVTTLRIVNILKANNIQATFFCVGNQIENNKSSILQAYNDGNLIESHSWSHKDFTTLNEAAIDNELTLTENEIFKVTGKRPAIIRPPYGSVNNTVENILISNQYTSVLWSIDTLDWDQRQVDNITKNVIDNVRPGEIILMHCDGDKKVTADALPGIINQLKEMGYGFVTLDKLLGCPAYK